MSSKEEKNLTKEKQKIIIEAVETTMGVISEGIKTTFNSEEPGEVVYVPMFLPLSTTIRLREIINMGTGANSNTIIQGAFAALLMYGVNSLNEVSSN